MAFVLRKQHINPKSPGSLPAEPTLAGKSQMLGGHSNPANPEAAGVFENMIWLNTSTSLNTHMNLAEVKPQEYVFLNFSFISDPSSEFSGLNNM